MVGGDRADSENMLCLKKALFDCHKLLLITSFLMFSEQGYILASLKLPILKETMQKLEKTLISFLPDFTVTRLTFLSLITPAVSVPMWHTMLFQASVVF